MVQKLVSSSERSPLCLHEFAYPSTTTTNGFQRLAVDVAVYQFSADDFDTRPVSGDWEYFFRDAASLMRKMREDQTQKEPWVEAGCRHHEHGDDRECFTEMFRARTVWLNEQDARTDEEYPWHDC